MPATRVRWKSPPRSAASPAPSCSSSASAASPSTSAHQQLRGHLRRPRRAPRVLRVGLHVVADRPVLRRAHLRRPAPPAGPPRGLRPAQGCARTTTRASARRASPAASSSPSATTTTAAAPACRRAPSAPASRSTPPASPASSTASSTPGSSSPSATPRPPTSPAARSTTSRPRDHAHVRQPRRRAARADTLSEQFTRLDASIAEIFAHTTFHDLIREARASRSLETGDPLEPELEAAPMLPPRSR
jgi:hypothetical protein